MNKPPRLPIDILAYWEDTHDLDEAEHGVYLNLLFLGFRQRDARIPNVDKDLRSFFRARMKMHGSRYNAMVPAILRRFFTLENSVGESVDPGVSHPFPTFFRQKKLSKVHENVLKIIANNTENGPKAHQKTSDNNDLAGANAGNQSNQNQNKENINQNQEGLIFKNMGRERIDSLLSDSTREKAKAIARGYDLGRIISAYAGFLSTCNAPPMSEQHLQNHFLSFVKTHVQKNPI